MSIIRQRTADPYTRVPNAVINDERLSFAERGLMAYLLSKPDGWTVQVRDLQRQGGIGRDAAYKLLKGPIDAGYIERKKRADGLVDYIVRDKPDPEKPEQAFEPDPEKPDLGFQDQGLVNTDKNKLPPIVPPQPTDGLAAVLDRAHAEAVAADRKRHGLPLNLADASAIATHCREFIDPNIEAEALIARRYRGCRGLRRLPAQAAASRAGEVEASSKSERPLPEGYIVREQEPAAFARAMQLSGTDIGFAKAWKFQPAIAAQARRETLPGGKGLQS